MAELLPKEQELLDRAAEVDTNKERAMESMAPEGKFAKEDLNSLVVALNNVLPMFERPPYPEFTEDIDGPFPTEFVKALTMVSEAAKASGLERLSWDIATVENIGDLEAIEARLDTLSTNQPFITWLKTDSTPRESQEQSGPPAPERPAAPPAPTPDTEALLASRA